MEGQPTGHQHSSHTDTTVAHLFVPQGQEPATHRGRHRLWMALCHELHSCRTQRCIIDCTGHRLYHHRYCRQLSATLHRTYRPWRHHTRSTEGDGGAIADRQHYHGGCLRQLDTIGCTGSARLRTLRSLYAHWYHPLRTGIPATSGQISKVKSQTSNLKSQISKQRAPRVRKTVHHVARTPPLAAMGHSGIDTGLRLLQPRHVVRYQHAPYQLHDR